LTGRKQVMTLKASRKDSPKNRMKKEVLRNAWKEYAESCPRNLMMTAELKRERHSGETYPTP